MIREMVNTFTGMVTVFQNDGILAIVTETLKFRVQLMLRREKVSQSGWNDGLNNYMIRSLEKIAGTVKAVTYNPQGPDAEELRVARLAEAQDRNRTLGDAYLEYSNTHINSDDIVMPTSMVDHRVEIDLSGQHPDYPQPSPDVCPNDWFGLFVTKLDNFVVLATNCDSRTQPSTINAYESAQLQSDLMTLYAICLERGGEANRIETPTGLLRSNYDDTYNADGSKNHRWDDSGHHDVAGPQAIDPSRGADSTAGAPAGMTATNPISANRPRPVTSGPPR